MSLIVPLKGLHKKSDKYQHLFPGITHLCLCSCGPQADGTCISQRKAVAATVKVSGLQSLPGGAGCSQWVQPPWTQGPSWDSVGVFVSCPGRFFWEPLRGGDRCPPCPVTQRVLVPPTPGLSGHWSWLAGGHWQLPLGSKSHELWGKGTSSNQLQLAPAGSKQPISTSVSLKETCSAPFHIFLN